MEVITYKIKPAEGSGGIDGGFFYTVRVDDFNAEPPADVEVYVLKDPSMAAGDGSTRKKKTRPRKK